MKKIIFKIILYLFIFLFFATLEKEVMITGFGIGFLYALIYCKEKPYITIPTYLIPFTVVSFSFPYLLYLYLSVFPAVVIYILLYLFNKKLKLWAELLFVLSSQIIKFFLYNQYVLQVVGCLISVLFFYGCVVITYAITVRGLRYKFSHLENALSMVFFSVVGAGGYLFTPFDLSLFYIIPILIILFGSAVIGKERSALVCLFYGIGASIVSVSFVPVGYCSVLFISFYLFSFNKYAGAAFMVGSFVATRYYMDKIKIFEVITVLLCALLVLIPDKFIPSLYKEEEKITSKTIINKDRRIIERKITKVAEAYDTIGSILKKEENVIPKEEEIIKYVQTGFCQSCKKKEVCREISGLRQLVTAALDNGKASPMDISRSLSEKCVRLPKLIPEVNTAVKKYRNSVEAQQGIRQGKTMVLTEIEGTRDILQQLSKLIGITIENDKLTEKKIRERLGYANVIAHDIFIYGGEKEELVVVLRKQDADKGQVKTILSDVMGVELTETDRQEEMGTVSITFERAPSFGILYGEAVCSAQRECGDNRRVIKLSHDKIMFVLSDGMGTGEDAQKTSVESIQLIESFYLAGFDHKTVFGSATKLLGLRKKENFSAIDIVVCDVQKGTIDFIKQGGRESYLISDGNLEMIEGETLPIGIIEDTAPQILHRKMKGGDYVIMVSDGVADRINQNKMRELLSLVRSGNPQVIADTIIEEGAKMPGQKDDMTAIVIRVVKNRK